MGQIDLQLMVRTEKETEQTYCMISLVQEIVTNKLQSNEAKGGYHLTFIMLFVLVFQYRTSEITAFSYNYEY